MLVAAASEFRPEFPAGQSLAATSASPLLPSALRHSAILLSRVEWILRCGFWGVNLFQRDFQPSRTCLTPQALGRATFGERPSSKFGRGSFFSPSGPSSFQERPRI